MQRQPPEEDHHQPVLRDEVVALLAPAAEGLIVDGTVGGGGHAAALLDAYPRCRLLAVDRDPEALEAAARRLESYRERVTFRCARFDLVLEELAEREGGADGILLDLGLSSLQLDRPGRGFSFRPGTPLDMRMERTGGRTAAELLNESEEDVLFRIFREYGELRGARRLAKEVTRRRRTRPLRTADDLVGVLAGALGRRPTVKEKARAFQALRIAVNEEVESLERALSAMAAALGPGGVAVVISYHSLEDRRVKEAFREWSLSCVCPPGLPVCTCRGRPLGERLTRRVVRPGEDEVRRNPRARSARLRAWRKAG